jgi:hypothetical protein
MSGFPGVLWDHGGVARRRVRFVEGRVAPDDEFDLRARVREQRVLDRRLVAGGARLQQAISWKRHGADSPATQIEYGRSESEAGIQISVYTGAPTAQRVAVCNTPGSITSVARTKVQGHVACEGSDYDDGSAFGWITQWIARPGLTIEVRIGDPETIPAARAIARKVAASAYPTSADVWSRLVRMTTRNPDVTRANADYESARSGTGTVDGARWTLTARIPRGFPLGRDDYRPTCVTLAYGDRAPVVCSNEPGGGALFARLDGQVFAFGVVPANSRDILLERQDRGHGEHGVVMTVRSTTAAGTTRRFFAAALPADNCGVVAYDVTAGRHVQVGFAPSLPSDGPPCNHPLPNAHTPLTTAPSH